MRIRPPKNLLPEELFQLLLETPRPKKDITFRLAAAPQLQLSVQALSSLELQTCKHNDQLILKTLMLENQVAFSSIKNLEFLTYREYQLLYREIIATLEIISPTFLNCEVSSWIDILTQGAQSYLNFLPMHSLGQCFQYSAIGSVLLCQDFPERYFNLPRNQLLDGHWLAYLAAKKVYKQRNLND